MFFNLFSRMSMLLQINDTKTDLKLVLFCGNFDRLFFCNKDCKLRRNRLGFGLGKERFIKTVLNRFENVTLPIQEKLRAPALNCEVQDSVVFLSVSLLQL